MLDFEDFEDPDLSDFPLSESSPSLSVLPDLLEGLGLSAFGGVPMGGFLADLAASNGSIGVRGLSSLFFKIPFKLRAI